MAFAATFFIVAFSTQAHGENACSGIAIIGAPDLDESWTAATNDLRKQMPIAPAGACAAMTLSVEPIAEGQARLLATSKDGRRAERLVDKPSSLGSVALGLVASLPPDDVTANDTSSDHTDRVAPSPSASSPRSTPKPVPTVVEQSKAPHVWLGGGLGVRAAEPSATGMLDLEAHGDLEARNWFLSVSLRYGSSIGETLSTRDASYEETVIGLGIGRNLPIGSTTLQVLLAPSIAAVTIDDDDDADGSNGSRSDVRVGAAVRWAIPLDNLWRFTITADSDFSPRSLTHHVYVNPDLPPLPFWTGGLRLGVAGKLL